MAKIKTYVLTISKRFPEYHARSGQWTNFKNRFLKGTKIHTIRNYEEWEKRFRQIMEGKAILSVREWNHVPYKSKQTTIVDLDLSHGIGLQKLLMRYDGKYVVDDKQYIPENILAKNDGLYPDDFIEWFKGYPKDKPLAIIHFTNFRY